MVVQGQGTRGGASLDLTMTFDQILFVQPPSLAQPSRAPLTVRQIARPLGKRLTHRLQSKSELKSGLPGSQGTRREHLNHTTSRAIRKKPIGSCAKWVWRMALRTFQLSLKPYMVRRL